MKSYRKNRIPQIIFGCDAAKETDKELQNQCVTRCLIVTDKGVRAAGLVDPILASLDACGISYIIFDDVMLRHTYATTLYRARVDLRTAQKLMGHSSIQVTADIYTHLEQEDSLHVSDKLNEYLSGKSENSAKSSQARYLIKKKKPHSTFFNATV